MSVYFEDLVVGQLAELGSHTFTHAEIVDFAKKFDPQPFHLSEEGARDSLFGALCASGWHTSAVWLRLMIDYRRRQSDQLVFRGETPARYGPSPGFEKIRWIKPVFVGDTINFRTQVHEKRDSKSRPEVGLLLSLNEGHDQHGDLVFSLISKMFVERRRPFKAA
jgi:acyl dehydratase